MRRLIDEVEKIIVNVVPWNTESLGEINRKLDNLKNPLVKEVMELKNIAVVRKYIELKNKVDYLQEKQVELCEYYPK